MQKEIKPLTHHESASNGGKKRWEGTTEKQRSEEMRRLAQLPRPSRRKKLSTPTPLTLAK